MKKLILTTAIMLGLASIIVAYNDTPQSRLKDKYKEYNMLVKNKKHGANIPQSRLDKLEIEIQELRGEVIASKNN